jgi:hypothetical protein
LKAFKTAVGVPLRKSPIFVAEQFGMMNRVGVFPKERWPSARKCPESAEPSVHERRSKNPAVRMVVKVNANIYSRNPPQQNRRSCHKGRSGPLTRDAHKLGMFVKPERACIRDQTSYMEDHAVQILRMRENMPAI